jgi:serine/threonine protein kinase/tetratricopeptide (TPR) repeat protein
VRILTLKRWQEVSPHLDHALSLPEEQRAVWLGALRGNDPELAGLLEELLDEHRALSESHFLEGQPERPVDESPLSGQQVGAYTLVSLLGHGGMGTVWLAQRSDGRFERQVAIKFLTFALTSQARAERFKREGSILGRLRHPHIAELIDAGISPSGAPYLVLEYVDGKHIDQYCDGRLLGTTARIELFLDVLGAVAHAHANLVVHRDIKPSNVLVRNDGQVKLLDFGIAKLLAGQQEEAAATALSLEQGGAALTPRFAAPEQIMGGNITTATDVYALGVLLYLLLTGQHPAGRETSSPAELVKAIVEAEPPRPSDVFASAEAESAAEKRDATPDEVRRQLRGDLDTIVGKALKKDPKGRYASVTAMADDLHRYLRNEPISARPDTFAYRTRKFVRRYRLAVVLASLVLVAVLGGVAGTLLQARRARRQRDFAFHQLDRAEAINEFNQFILSDASPSGKPFTTKELLRYATHILEKQKGFSGDRVELMASIGEQASFLGDSNEGTRTLEEAYKLSRGIPEASVRALAACQLASALVQSGDLVRAESLFQEGMHELPDEPQFAIDRVECLRRGSEVAQERGDAQAGIARMQAAQQALHNSNFNSDWAKAEVLMDLGEAYRVGGENYKASSVFQDVNTLLLSMGRDETRSAGVLFNDWALALEKLGRPREAESLLRRSLDIQGGGIPDSAPAVVLNNYALTLKILNRLPEALDYSERSYKKAQQTANQFAAYRSLYLQAQIYLDEHHYNHAEDILGQLEPMLRREFSPDSLWFGLMASVQAELESQRGNSQHALMLADRAVSILETLTRSKKQGSDFLPGVLLRRATVELAAGRPMQAEVDASRALAQFQAALPPGALSSYVGSAYLELGYALRAQGKGSEANTAFRSAVEHLQNALGPNHPQTLAARQLAGMAK